MSRNGQYDDWKIKCPYYRFTKGLEIFCLNRYSCSFLSKKMMLEYKEEHCRKVESGCRIRRKNDKEECRNG